MKKNNFIDVVYTHTEGEPTCIVHSGIIYPHNSDIIEKRMFLEKNYDWLRKSLMQEPRGHQGMYGVFLTPPSRRDTNGGMIWMDGSQFMHMCGHGTIAVTMAMVALGLVPSSDPVTQINLETTAGDVSAEVFSSNGEVTFSQFKNVPAFVQQKDVPIDLPDFGEVKADIVFGGNYFGIIKWDHADLNICPENGTKFAELGKIAKKRLRNKLNIQHPVKEHINELDIVTFYHKASRDDAFYRNVHIFSDGQLDRSPGGTGTSAMMAMLEARGQIKIGQKIKSEGLLGSGTFEGSLVAETVVGDIRGVIPQVKGKANIIGYAKWLLDPDDPVGKGFLIR
jgi:proline racemase